VSALTNALNTVPLGTYAGLPLMSANGRSRIAPPIATTDLSFPKELNIILKEEDIWFRCYIIPSCL